MTVYVLAQLSMTNRAAYDRYQARFMEVFQEFEGRLLAADEHSKDRIAGADTVALIVHGLDAG